jgi:hypothetical protein
MGRVGYCTRTGLALEGQVNKIHELARYYYLFLSLTMTHGRKSFAQNALPDSGSSR